MGKLNDLDYCYASIVLLEELEKVSYARNQRLRQFHEKVHARQAIVAAALALILPVIVWIYLLTSKVSIFEVKTSITSCPFKRSPHQIKPLQIERSM